MSDRDPAFLWETEALRSASHRVAEEEIDHVESAETDRRWVTLREANRATGIPVETLRKWARRNTVPSYLTPTNQGTSIRMIDLDGVKERAADLGRPVQAAGDEPSPPVAPSPATTESSAPPGTMIVPIDAWNKMLNQLGNLHEAGQQLASARERAARAETEADFLRERLAELRSQISDVESSGVATGHQDQTPTATTSDSTPATTADPPEKVWHYLVRRVRDRNLG